MILWLIKFIKMKAAVISLGSKSSIMVVEAMREFYDQVDMVNLKEVEVALGKESGIFYQSEKLSEYDCVYVKGSFRYAPLLRSITSMLEGKVAYLPLPSASFTIVHNKLLTHLVLEQHQIPMPRTYVGPNLESAKNLLKKTNYPLVMKFPEGTQGKGVMFAESYASASSMLDALGALNQPFLIQQYVESGGTDIRVLVIGNKAIAGMRRKAQTEEKRANLHAGGSGELITLTREISTLAIKTAQALGADICGVDILEGPLGPVVIEANISPGLQGLNSVCQINIPREIAKYFYEQTIEVLNKRKKDTNRDVMNHLDLEDVSSSESQPSQDLITNLVFKGERILLPQLVSKITEFNELGDYMIKAKKGYLEINEFKI